MKHLKTYKLFEEDAYYSAMTSGNVLYHATYKPLLSKIKKEGLGGPSSKKNWPDSKKGIVYLSTDPEVAQSYAETSEEVPESWLDQIIILKIKKSLLDRKKLSIDKNVKDNIGDTLEYKGIIPFDQIEL